MAAAVPAEVQHIERLTGSGEQVTDPFGRGDGSLDLQRHPQVAAGIGQLFDLLLHRQQRDRNNLVLTLHHQRRRKEQQHPQRRHGCGGVLSSHSSTSWSVASDRSSGGWPGRRRVPRGVFPWRRMDSR